MSGASLTTECPNCGEQMETYSDWKPYHMYSHDCLHCGWSAYMKTHFLSLKEVNNMRADLDMKPIKKLTEKKFDWEGGV